MLERKGHPREEEVAWVVVAGVGDGGAGEEDAVSDAEADVAGDLPVEVEVGLEAEPLAARPCRLVDRGVLVELREEDQVGADLEAAEGRGVGEGEGRGADAEAREVGDGRGEGEAGVQQAPGVEPFVVGAGAVAAERVRAVLAVLVAAREDQLGAEARASRGGEEVVEAGVRRVGSVVLVAAMLLERPSPVS